MDLLAENQCLFLRVADPGLSKSGGKLEVLQACFRRLRLVLLLYRMQDDAGAGNRFGWVAGDGGFERQNSENKGEERRQREA